MLTPEASQELYDRLYANRDTIEARYGKELEWEALPGKRACRVADYTPGDVGESGRHDEFISWFLESGARLREALEANR